MQHAAADHNAPQTPSSTNKKLNLLMIGCIGVVYGDIGTSPLYAFRASAKQVMEGGVTNNEILGIISLILWALIITVTIKYVLFLTRVDNRGEGGILALMALVQKVIGQRFGLVFVAAVIGFSLFFGEAAVTPAISVLSAMDGLKLIHPGFAGWVLPLGIILLVMLFSVQKFGTQKVSAFYGPFTTCWFLLLGGIGLYWIVKFPLVLSAISPHYGFQFLFEHGMLSFVVLGSVFLAVTGAEALYTDLGHFGREPIKRAWLFIVLPCLTLNYMGQGALLMATPSAIDNTFFLMFPHWALIPMILIATMATIIASQAVITGAYSASRQAMQLGFLPRLEVRHTSETHEGQIYMPQVNLILAIAVIFLCLTFHSADALAAAYGIAVCGTMIATSVVSFFVFHKVWKKSRIVSALIIAPFLLVELVFFSSNLLKLIDGAFVPLMFGVMIFMIVITWVQGTRYLTIRARRQAISMVDLLEMLEHTPPVTVKGTAIFLTSDQNYAPETMIHNLKHNQVLHEHNIILSIQTEDIPRVAIEQRASVEVVNERIMRIVLHFGFMETPNVPAALYCARSHGYDIDVEGASFFLGHRKIVAEAHQGLPLWQDRIYLAMAKGAVDATDYFRIPHEQAVEIGMRRVV